MSKSPEKSANAASKKNKIGQVVGTGGELHQVASDDQHRLTTNQGFVVSDDHNSLKAGSRGPVLLEDFALREKISHFDHERVPERVVHARGSAAHGYFELTDSLSDLTTAAILCDTGEKTEVFARFSTVAGSKGSPDLARDVRGFSVKFYTKQGNWDIVGNNIPVFFIQDAIRFPDLIHAVKPEPDRGFPQAQTAHDTFWDFIACTPESMHMIMWIMSDRTIPRSLRMIEGFGVHSFRLVDSEGKSTFVKFHWRPKLGLQSVLWDEAVKINGADPDFHRRDLWNAINDKDFPEWELGVQLFDEEFAENFDFDHLDSTKLIPEEDVPLRIIGRMVLNRNVDNFFAETEQVAFCTANVPPGIDFSDDPMLLGRNFSYQDTQLIRLGGPNFTQIPINQPKGCPAMNFQRDGYMQMDVPKGRVAYQPSMLDPSGPREDPDQGTRSFAAPVEGAKRRELSETFADHYSQGRQFFLSQTDVEQDHIVDALVFELSKLETAVIRARLLAHLTNIDPDLSDRVALGLGETGEIQPVAAARSTRDDLAPSPALSILENGPPPLEGRTIGCLVSDGADAALIADLDNRITAVGAQMKIVATRIAGVSLADGSRLTADFQLAGGPSVLFDAVMLVVSHEGAMALSDDPAAVAFVCDAFRHCKVIGHVPAAKPLLETACVKADPGVVEVPKQSAKSFIIAAANGRIWDREFGVKARP